MLNRLWLLCTLVGINLLMMACEGGDTAVSNTAASNTEQPIVAQSSGVDGTLEGTIVEIMESWPLQLSVNTPEGTVHVELLDETVITQNGTAVEPSALANNQKIYIEGKRTATGGMLAEMIEIQQ